MTMTAVEAERRFAEITASMEAMKTEIIAKVAEHESEMRVQHAKLLEQQTQHEKTASDGA